MIIPRIKYFAHRDYTDLNSKGRKELRERRSNFAKALKKFRKKANDELKKVISPQVVVESLKEE